MRPSTPSSTPSDKRTTSRENPNGSAFCPTSANLCWYGWKISATLDGAKTRREIGRREARKSNPVLRGLPPSMKSGQNIKHHLELQSTRELLPYAIQAVFSSQPGERSQGRAI